MFTYKTKSCLILDKFIIYQWLLTVTINNMFIKANKVKSIICKMLTQILTEIKIVDLNYVDYVYVTKLLSYSWLGQKHWI